MASFFDKIKKLLGITAPTPAEPTPSPSTPAGDAAPVTPTPASTAPGGPTPPRSATPPPKAPRPLHADLSEREHRKLALKVDPFRTEWIGRTDVIPPATDNRTALIDRGLVLRGYFTEDEIAEFHRIGDLWLRYHRSWQDTYKVQLLAGKSAQDAVEAWRRARTERRDRVLREARERREARARDIERLRREDILFLGRGVSNRLGQRTSNTEALKRLGLPVLHTPAELAAALGLPIARLRWLAFHHEAARRLHYVFFTVKKRSGGTRTLAAPMRELIAVQRFILANLLAPLAVEAPAHGFVRGRSTVTNARPHVGQDVVINLDLRDFFPTITFPRVVGLFTSMGWSGAVATLLALLCTEAPRQRVTLDGEELLVAAGPRALPQGAPTSPALSNLIARRLDRRLSGIARSMGWTYTRYADDLTFSAPPGHREAIGLLQARVAHVIRDEGFALHPDKGRVQRAARQQSVTGVVVNARPGLDRREVRRLRAILHQARTTGLEAQNRRGHPNFLAYMRGKLAYLTMIDPVKGRAMRLELEQLVQQRPLKT